MFFNHKFIGSRAYVDVGASSSPSRSVQRILTILETYLGGLGSIQELLRYKSMSTPHSTEFNFSVQARVTFGPFFLLFWLQLFGCYVFSL